MSLMEPEDAAREPMHSNPTQEETYTAAGPVPSKPQTHHRRGSYDDAIYQEFFEAMEDGMEQTQKQTAQATTLTTTTTTAINGSAPPLPQRNLKRSSQLLLNGLKLSGGALGSHQDLGQTTPHDVYMSSEEDASSSADDFSDYDWESGSEYDEIEGNGSAASSPVPRRSHEITARAVSVVFAGKPAIVDINIAASSPIKRSHSPTGVSPSNISPNIIESKALVAPASSGASISELPSRRSSSAISFVRRLSVSSATSSVLTRESTPASAGTAMAQHTPGQSSMVASIHTKQKTPPPFLNIDPYANGSTYSLELPKKSMAMASPLSASPATDLDTLAPRTPKTPTTLLKDFSRSLSIVKKRSKPVLANVREGSNRDSMTLYPASAQPRSAEPKSTCISSIEGQHPQNEKAAVAVTTAATSSSSSLEPHPPQTAIAHITSAAQSQTVQNSPVSPTPAEKRSSIWSGLNARRRSIKLTASKLL